MSAIVYKNPSAQQNNSLIRPCVLSGSGICPEFRRPKLATLTSEVRKSGHVEGRKVRHVVQRNPSFGDTG
ncbi:hypothetical protein Nepgr_003375 [Nepenthes gracilis]|uniref:Uncharacterized protein n=1 Tax=Nepenthes gracilis TaxID=150966 RepID=A0AAD3RZD9_NEPGR|nr:hypothetical protein Nepgr_003375 [Nepenthes gracilis]